MSSVSDNKDEIINVAWLDNSFLEKALRSSEDDKLKVTSYQLTRATGKGDNYASEMYRVKVDYTRGGQPETTSLILKAIPNKEEMARLMTEAKTFTKETLVLSSVVPNMQRLLEEASPSQFQPFSPKFFHSQTNPDVIVMEDLKEIGYKMAKRTLGLDMKHSLLVMRKIARFHACSVVLHEKDPAIIQPFYQSSNGIPDHKVKQTYETFFGKGMREFVKEVENWPDCKFRFAAKLQNLVEKTTDTLIDVMKRDDKEFNVFVHGDLWLNNMMFLYSDETGDVEDVRFVDHQLCQFRSPATDLLYFMHTSVSTDLIEQHPKLVKEYHKTLQETLTLLGYEHLSPTMEQLQKQLENKSKYAVIICCTVLPVVLADPNYIPDMDKVMKNESSLHFSDVFKRAIRKYLPELERKGWL